MDRSKTILLVEDDRDDQFFFIEAITEIGNTFICSISNNGKEALEHLKNPNFLPDVIFMDINMPLMDGIECLKELIKNPKTKDLPVVIISTSSEQSEVALKLGAKAFVKKTHNTIAFRSRLKQLINLNVVQEK